MRVSCNREQAWGIIRSACQRCHMQNYTTGRWIAPLCLTAVFVGASSLDSRAESGGAAGGGGTSAAAGGAPGSPGSGVPGAPRGKSFDGTLKTPDRPGMSQQQRDRAQRLEEKLRQGEAAATTPQTQMSDRLEELHHRSSAGPSGSSQAGR